MQIPRFFQSSALSVGEEVLLSASVHRHAIQVLRLKENAPLVLFNGDGGEFSGRISAIKKRESWAVIDAFHDVSRESGLQTHLFLSLIKPDKMDYAIQKAVEAGVTTIQPMITERSVIRIKASRLEKKMRHWQGIIVAACEQSGRTEVPGIFQPVPLSSCLPKSAHNPRLVMLPGEYPSINQLACHDGSVDLLVGPEGGFTESEVQLLLDSGVQGVSFGPRILRAETAVLAGLVAIQQAWGDLSAV